MNLSTHWLPTILLFPSTSKEVRCHWAGISEHVGGPITWTLVTDTTQKIIHRSSICSTLDPDLRSLSLDPLKTTDVKMADPPFEDDFDAKYGENATKLPAEAVCICDSGEKIPLSEDT